MHVKKYVRIFQLQLPHADITRQDSQLVTRLNKMNRKIHIYASEKGITAYVDVLHNNKLIIIGYIYSIQL